MKKIFTFTGSNSQKSNTLYFTQKILEKVCEKSDEQIQYEIYHGANCNISMCRGCSRCFLTGKCTLDQTDDMKLLKSKMLESDIIIFSSPIYVHNVTGIMKNFIDRIAYWTHLMRLSSKHSIILTTTSNNGHIYVEDYLKSVSNYLGLDVMGCCNISEDKPQQLYNAIVEFDIIDNFSTEIIAKLKENSMKSNLMLEVIFQSMKKKFLVAKEILNDLNSNAEVDYWYRNKIIDCDSHQELLDKIKLGDIKIF